MSGLCIVVVLLGGCGGGGTAAPGVETTITQAPQPVSSDTRPAFAFSSSDPSATFEASIDGAPFQAVPNPYTAPALNDGVHILQVRAVGDTTPATFSWRVDTTPPTARLSFPTPFSTTSASTLSVCGTTDDASGAASVTVNGVPATSTDQFATWAARIPLQEGENTVRIVATDRAGNTSAVDAATVTNRDLMAFGYAEDIAIDTKRSNLLVVDSVRKALIRVDPVSGDRTVISASKLAQVGTGIEFRNPRQVVYDAVRDQALVLDRDLAQVIQVDLDTGARTPLVLDKPLTTPVAMGLDETGEKLHVFDHEGCTLRELDLLSGQAGSETLTFAVTSNLIVGKHDLALSADRVIEGFKQLTLFGGLSSALLASLGIFEDNQTARFIFDTKGVIWMQVIWRGDVEDIVVLQEYSYIVDAALPGIVRTTRDTGFRDVLTEEFESLSCIEWDAANNRMVGVDEKAGEIVAITTDGAKSVLSSATQGGGPLIFRPRGIAVSADGQEAYVLDTGNDSVLRVDLDTGNRTRISGYSVGFGDHFGLVGDRIATYANRTYAALLDRSSQALIRIDLATGERKIVYQRRPGDSTSTMLAMDVDGNFNQALVADDRGFLWGIHLDTGARTIVSEPQPVMTVASLVVDSPARTAFMLEADPSTSTIWRVNLVDGAREAIASVASDALDEGVALTYDAQRQVLYASSPKKQHVVAIDVASGQQVVVTGSADGVVWPAALAVDETSNTAALVDRANREVARIDLATGFREVVSGDDNGQGTHMLDPHAVGSFSPGQSVLVVEFGRLFAVDLVSGDRVLISQ